MKRGLLLLLAALSLLLGAAPASADTQARKVLLGVLGASDRFEQLTGQHSSVVHSIVGWDQGVSWGSPFTQLFETMGEVPMLGIGMDRRGGGPITSRDIAQGKGDAYLLALNKALGEWQGERIYVRPFGEMNGHWSPSCAFDKNGRSKGEARSTAWFKKAFARVYLIVHGPASANAQLRALGLPPVNGELAANPMPRVRVIWNPQGYGSPNLPGNTAQAYYPGDKFVDVVGNDLYNIRGKAEWAAANALYKAHKNKPHAFPEWANWSVDDPNFIREMAFFVKTHPQVELLAYYHGRPGSPWDLASKPATRKAYKALIVPLG